jgi:hypothetical protein
MVFKKIKILAICYIIYHLVVYSYVDVWFEQFVNNISYGVIAIGICEIAIHLKEMRNKWVKYIK